MYIVERSTSSMKRILLILSLLLTQNLYSQSDKWSKTDITLESMVVVASIADWQQTKQIQKTPGFQEQNPILGEHPHQSKIDVYFLSSILLHIWIMDKLPAKYRKYVAGVSIIFEGAMIKRNISLGFKVSF